MRIFLILILIAMSIFSCDKSSTTPSTDRDSVNWEHRYIDYSTDCELTKKIDSISILVLTNKAGKQLNIIDSLTAVNHNLQDSLFLRKAQIANCKKYVRICLRNPSQDQFLKGWLIRALDL